MASHVTHSSGGLSIIGDLNRDMQGEIFIANDRAVLQGRFVAGSWSFDTIVSFQSSNSISSLLITDATNTGKNDMLFSRMDGYIYRMTSWSSDSFTVDTFLQGTSPSSMTWADLDGDNEIEIYAVTNAGGIYRFAYIHDTLPPQDVHVIYPQNNTWFLMPPDSLVISWNRVLRIGRGGDFPKHKLRVLAKGNASVKYALEIAMDSLFDSITIVDTTDDTLFVLDGLMIQEKNYLRIKPFDLAGNEGQYSEVIRFGIDSIRPMIDSVEVLADTTYEGPFNVVIRAHDITSGIDSVVLYYKRGEDTTWVLTCATHDTQDIYIATIPRTNIQNDTIRYYVTSTDYAQLADTVPQGAPTVYYYFVAAGINERHSISHFDVKVPVLSQNTVLIKLALPERMKVHLDIYDIQGRKIVTPLDNELDRGYHNLKVRNLKRGIYIYHLSYEKQKIKGKFIVVGE